MSPSLEERDSEPHKEKNNSPRIDRQNMISGSTLQQLLSYRPTYLCIDVSRS